LFKRLEKGLITQQVWKPISPIIMDEAINRFFLKQSVQMTEQINRDEFLIGKPGLEITQALRFQRALIIVDLTDKQIKLNQLVFHRKKILLNSLACLFSTLDSHSL